MCCDFNFYYVLLKLRRNIVGTLVVC
uniref:Uncharacterized protein n=1 Tax=Arundo donax TaxID=35708 RepID=A0A0A9H2M6_ARUDO